MKKKYLKSEKGIAGTDALIAVLIIALFTGLISTVLYNIYLSNSSIKRMAQATSYITDVFEYTDKIYYDEVTVGDNDNLADLLTYFNTGFASQGAYAKQKDGEEVKEYIDAKYKMNIDIVNYNQTEGNTDKLDLLKIVTISVSYKLGNRDQKIEMSKIKRRENLITPNSPEIIQINTQDNEKIVPIKYINNKWQVTDKNDSTWYNYDNGYWAAALRTTENLKIGDEITISGNETNIYAWIPRYAYNNLDETDIKFMYSTSNNYVTTEVIEGKEYSTITSFDQNYDVTLFNGETAQLRGRWITLEEMQQQEVPIYFNIFNNSKYKQKIWKFNVIL